MYLFLVRHAQSEDSKNHWQTPDSKLSKIGEIQSNLLSKKSRLSKLDLIFSSKWERSKKTAEILSNKLKVKTEIIDFIHERKQTNKIYGSPRDSNISNKYIEEYKKNFKNLDWKFTKDDESIRDVLKRATKLADLLIKQYGDKNILVVSHDVFVRCFLSMILLENNYSDKAMSKIIHLLTTNYTGISLLGYDQKREIWKVYYINDFSHLKHIDTIRN